MRAVAIVIKPPNKGEALSIARCVPPIDRIKADKIFNDFMQRVNLNKFLNADHFKGIRLFRCYEKKQDDMRYQCS